MTNGDAGGGPAAATSGRSQPDTVVEGIKRMIMTGALTPGSRLPIERDLAAELGVSRSSLREGVRALALMGVLETRQGDGTYVTTLEPGILLRPIGFLVDLHRPEHVAGLQSVRRTLEVEAAGRAALRITANSLAAADAALADMEALLKDPACGDHDAVMSSDIEFHRVIAAASGNPTLEAIIEALASRTVRGRLWRAINEDGAEFKTYEEHRTILEALRSGDPDAAGLTMGAHLLAVERYLLAHAADDLGDDNAAVA